MDPLEMKVDKNHLLAVGSGGAKSKDDTHTQEKKSVPVTVVKQWSFRFEK